MSDYTSAKLQIEALVKSYVETYADEFRAFSVGAKMKKDNLDTNFAEVKGSQYLERQIYEIPETLYFTFKIRLPEDAFKWFRSKEGSRWFAKKYPVFAAGEKV